MPTRRSYHRTKKDSKRPGKTRRTKALVTGSVALGAYVTGAVVRWARRTTLYRPEELPAALKAAIREQELMEGRARFYERAGAGTPVVLLHGFNVASSSYEMKPIFEHVAATTNRPVYALDWFGFGLSDRPPVRYRPALFLRQLRRFLSETLNEPADVVAVSLGAAYAAVLTAEAPFLVRKLVLLAPMGLSRTVRGSLAQRTLLGLADGAGAFELMFSRLTRREALRRFYGEQVFHDGAEAPHSLVNYAFLTTHVRGAHHAPRRFFDGTLFDKAQVVQAYASVRRPTLIVVPKRGDGLAHTFDALPDVGGNDAYLQAHTLPSGLLPQWETPAALFDLLDAFLAR